MVQHPHVWKRAQAEIDAVVGTDRLPEFNDRPSLPYVDAIIREVLRWRPVFPLCTCQKAGVFQIIPKYSEGGLRSAMRSDIYNGYYIPQGMSYRCMLSTRSSEFFTRGNRRLKRLVRSSWTP